VAACVVGAAAVVALNVVGVDDPPSRGATNCSTSDAECIARRYARLVERFGPARAFKAFRSDYGSNAMVRASCHRFTHVIGRAAALRDGDVEKAYRAGDRFCGSGYYHGVVEKLVEGPARATALDRPDEVCAGLRRRAKRSVDHFNCAHGLGHGFMAVRANDVPRSLKLCDRLRSGYERDNCYAGVFMQNVMAENDTRHPSRYLDAERPLKLCEDLATRYRRACLERQILYALERYRGDFRSVFGLCAGLGARYRAECDRRVGGAAAELNVSSQPDLVSQSQATAGLCRLAPDAGARKRCAEGAVGHFVYYYDGTDEAAELCRALGPLAPGCDQAAETLYRRSRGAS